MTFLKYLQTPRVYWGIAALLFILAVLVRGVALGSVPYGINQDEAMAMVDAKALADYGTDRFGMFMPAHFTAWGVGQMSVLLSYITAPFIRLFGMTEVVVRIPMLLTSLMGLLLCFLYAKEFLGRRAGLVVLFFLAINPWHIMQSRWALDCNMFPHFIMLGIFLLYKGLRRPVEHHAQTAVIGERVAIVGGQVTVLGEQTAVIGERRMPQRPVRKPFLYLSMVAFALCMYAYGIAWFSIPILLAGLCAYLLYSKHIRWTDALICAGVFTAVAWPIFGVMAVNFFGLPTIETPLVTIPHFPDTVRASDLLPFVPADKMRGQLISNFAHLLRILLQVPCVQPFNTLGLYGTLYPLAIPFIFAGTAGLVKGYRRTGDLRRKAGYMFLLIWLGTAVVTCLLVNEANVNQANILFYPLIVACAAGVHALLRSRRGWVLGAGAAVLVLFAWTFSGFVQDYFSSAHRFFPGFGQAVRHAEQSGYDRLYITAKPVILSPQTSQILTMFYAQTDAEYSRGIREGFGKDGRVLPPFEERYRFLNFARVPFLLRNPDVMYIISIWEAHLFDEELFDIVWFYHYGVATLNHPAE